MATNLAPHEDYDRISTAPHSSHVPHPAHPAHHSRWALPALAAFALVGGGLTAARLAWHADQGGPTDVPPGNTTTEHTVAAPSPTAIETVTSDGEEDAPLPGTLPFDDYVARKTLELRARGLRCARPGQVDLRVTFAPSGNSTRTEVVSHSASPAASCIVNRFENVTIPAFQGREERSVDVSVAVR